MGESDLGLWGLFFSAFVSATLFPGGSEVVLGVLSTDPHFNPLVLLGTATLGNTLGGMSTWLLGRVLAWRFPVRDLAKPRQRQAVQRLRRWGSPVLLLSWLPVLGDPLCLAAGWLRVHWLSALCFIGLGKALRYAAVIYLVAPV